MVKKKRQCEPFDNNDDSSTESCDEKQTINNNQGGIVGLQKTIECPHINKSVDPTRIRKLFKTINLDTKNCIECQLKLNIPEVVSKNDDEISEGFEYDNTLWLCLKCGNQLCGRAKNKHALQHYMTPRSDSHALAVNTTTYDIWCYQCDNEVNAQSRKKLIECIDIIKKELQRPSSSSLTTNNQQNNLINNIEDKIIATVDIMRPLLDDTNLIENKVNNKNNAAVGDGCNKINNIQTTNIESLPRVRGLTNLGNTCFFNAVLQCLAQTPYLLPVLRESSEPGERFQLPGGVLKLNDGNETLLPPITGTLNSWGNLTATLAETLEELQSSGGVFTPRKLLSQLTTKWPQFAGGDQHDSHELLRHLLESVRSEDLRRYQTVILHSLGFSSKVDPQVVEGEMKQKIKFYGQQAADRIMRPEQVFRGFLVSTLTCQDCYHTSSRHEYFLDMSLPVMTEKPQPPVRRKSSPEPSSSVSTSLLQSSTAGGSVNVPGTNSQSNVSTNQLSKHQLKKEKEKERKAKRVQKQQKKIQQNQDALQALTNTIGGKINESSNIMDSNIANNEDDNNSMTSSSSSCEPSDADVEDNLEDTPKNNTSTLFNQTVPPLYDNNGNDENVLPINIEKRDDLPENLNKELNEKHVDDKQTNIVLTLGISMEGGANVVNKQKLDEQLNDTATKTLEKLSINENKNKNNKQQRIRTTSYTDWSTTIAPRYQCDDGECSVQSCLNNFTALELMTGNNKVGCDACTKRHNNEKLKNNDEDDNDDISGNGKNNNKKTNIINTNATKQFLISSPPAVLILHLKRFQVGQRCMFRKLSKHVTFPFLLDLAPFCGSKVKKLPNINRYQKKLIYSLYGIVEHSGGMYGGHYTAFVKVRPQFNNTNKRWSFLPQGSKAELDQTDEQRVRLEEALARDKARELGLATNDSDDSSSSTSQSINDDVVVDDEELGAVGGSPLVVENTDNDQDITPPPGKWYYVSDSRVQEISEESVLNAQAYLLFYERIY